MKIYAFADEASANIDEQIIALKENGLDGLEIRNVDGVNIADITEEKAIEVKEKMDKAGLKVWSIGSPIGKIEIHNANEHKEKFKHVLKVAKILRAKNIRLFSYHLPKGCNLEDYTPKVIENLKELVALTKGANITLCHENEKGIFGDTPERCLAIHKAIPEIKAIFDPANYIQCGIDTKKAWEMIKPYVEYLHIKDALSDGSVVPAGMGEGNLSFILEEYKQMGGYAITLEPHLTIFEGLSKLEGDEKSVVGEVYKYSSNIEAFKAAADSLKKIL